MAINSYSEAAREKENSFSETCFRSIINTIQYNNKEVFWPDEEGWIQFVKDHYEQIKAKAYIVYTDVNEINIYAYSLETYLEKNQIPKSLGWIVAWLNEIKSNMYFDYHVPYLMIPDFEMMYQLRQQYITHRVVYQKATGSKEL